MSPGLKTRASLKEIPDDSQLIPGDSNLLPKCHSIGSAYETLGLILEEFTSSYSDHREEELVCDHVLKALKGLTDYLVHSVFFTKYNTWVDSTFLSNGYTPK